MNNETRFFGQLIYYNFSLSRIGWGPRRWRRVEVLQKVRARSKLSHLMKDVDLLNKGSEKSVKYFGR